jgi:hypothetical protein
MLWAFLPFFAVAGSRLLPQAELLPFFPQKTVKNSPSCKDFPFQRKDKSKD